MMTHPITNAWGRTTPRRLLAKERVLYRSPPDRSYNHHAQITHHDGRLLVTWSEGERDEDMPGQRMMLITSDDAGVTWSAPRPLCDYLPGRFGKGVVTSEGIHVHQDTLVAYAGYYDRTEFGMLMYYAAGGRITTGEQPFIDGAHTRIFVSRDRGAGWSEAGRIDAFVPNLAPQRLASGRLILPGNVTFEYTDDTTGLTGWRRSGLPRIPPDTIDAPGAYEHAHAARGDREHYCEGSCYQLDDGTIRMMLRTNRHQLAVSQSNDNGASWSEPVLTEYTDADSRHQFGRLPDGRFFGLSNPQPRSVRTPLVLALSRDGDRFDQHFIVGDEPNFLPRIHGVHKYGRYGYPSLCLVGGTAYVVYTINKEDVALTTFPATALDV